jgi:hypothetical protein
MNLRQSCFITWLLNSAKGLKVFLQRLTDWALQKLDLTNRHFTENGDVSKWLGKKHQIKKSQMENSGIPIRSPCQFLFFLLLSGLFICICAAVTCHCRAMDQWDWMNRACMKNIKGPENSWIQVKLPGPFFRGISTASPLQFATYKGEPCGHQSRLQPALLPQQPWLRQNWSYHDVVAICRIYPHCPFLSVNIYVM